MTIEDVYRYMISGYFGVMEMDSYKLKEYILADIKQYIKDYMEQNPSNNFSLDEEIEKVGLTEQAYLKLTDAITKAFGARQYEKFKESQQEELDNLLSDNLSKIQDRLIQKLADDGRIRKI